VQEAQRQRNSDMFVKKPSESFQNLTQMTGTQSASLLTQLLNPNPEIFPVGHPYRRGSSSSEIIRGMVGRTGQAHALSMQWTKSAVAMPVSSQVHSSGGYRPKGRPQDQELEDNSGSEAEFGDIQAPMSVVQEKLKELAERRGIVAHRNQSTSQDQYPHSQPLDPNMSRCSLNGQMITPSHATPIPVLHPYSLPPPAPPSTPRTTRRLMLSTKLSESLCRNLLWERQVSKVNLAVRRSAGSSGSHLSQPGGVQPLTTALSMVQLLPKGTMAHPNLGSPVGSVTRRPEQVSSQGDGSIKKERESGGADYPGPSVQHEKEVPLLVQCSIFAIHKGSYDRTLFKPCSNISGINFGCLGLGLGRFRGLG
jgi:Protein of unknown function (DUF3295)